jgi:DNA topoisomerase-3
MAGRLVGGSVPSHLFVAEKPSLAEAIAKARAVELGVSASKGDGFWKVGPDLVSNVIGHFYELAQPQDYDARYEKWTVEDLPIVPEKWRLTPRKEDYVRSQLGKLKKLLADAKRNSSFIVNAGDAAREGQLLIDEALQENGIDPFAPNVMRLWVKSFAEKDMLAALKGMVPNAEKRTLFSSAVCRQRADWTHGMNLTRLFTILARDGGSSVLVSVGRVQTPTLKLVVDRDREIEAFRPTNHFQPKITFRHANGEFEADWIIPPDHEGVDSEGRLIDKAVAEKIAAKVNGKIGSVTAYVTSPKSKPPPLPFSLSQLQKACSAKFSLTAQQTLDVAQSLYEKHKATTYPRSDSQYLPVSILKDEAPGIMKALAGTDALGEAASKANMDLKSPAWNDSKVSDHHGIIPTSEFSASKLKAMEPRERDVFLMIARAFVAQFYPDKRWDAQSAQIGCEGERFKANGATVKDPGWTVLYGADDKDDDEEEDGKGLPAMRKDDPVTALGCRVDSKRTQPPKRFTDGTLIDAMSHVDRFVKDPEVKKKLKESSGIGTEATRAAILETLLNPRRTYLKRDRKFLISTPTGRDVIDSVPGEVADPGLTALWEDALKLVEGGTLSLDKFMEVQVANLRQRIDLAKTQGVSVRSNQVQRVVRPIEGDGEPCPKCGVGKLATKMVLKGDHQGKKYLSCTNWKKDDPKACDYRAWPQDKIEPLPEQGQPCPQCGKGKLQTKAVQGGEHKGKRFLSCDAWRRDDPNACKYTAWPARPAIPPLPGDGEMCPKCGKGVMVTRQGKASGNRFLSCNAWKKDDPKSCSHAIFSEDSRPKVQPIPGDGELCKKCGKGKMRTKSTKGDKLYLSCDNWRRDDKTSCDNVDWSYANEQEGPKGSRPAAAATRKGSSPRLGRVPGRSRA